MVSIETADSALKSFYLDAVTEALDMKTNPLLAQIQRSTAEVVGKDVKKLVKFGVNGGIGAGSETGTLPAASGSGRVQLTSTLKNLYGTIEISDKALRASANDEGAFVNLLNDEMQTLVKSASFNFGRMLYGDGTALVGYVADILDNNTLEIEDMRNLFEGMLLDFKDMSGEFIPQLVGRKIIALDRAKRTITLDGPDIDGLMNGGENIYLHGSENYEITGLKAIFGQGDLYGVNREQCSAMKPYKKMSVCDITENVIQTAIDTIEENSGSKINFIVCSWGVRRALAEVLRQNKVVMPTMELAGGFTAMSFNGIPVVADRFCPRNTMYLLNTNDFKLCQLCDWKWLEGEDGKILKQIPGKPVYTATLVKYAELLCENPSGQGILVGINEA